MPNLIRDIKFEGTNDCIVWRSTIEDFETGSVLTVMEAQTALFYMNGACVGELGAGRHILETENIPFLNKLFSSIAGGKNIFHAQVYFVNNAEMLSMKWGVGDIVYQDTSGIVFNIGCNGEINLSCVKPRYIVEKVSGMQPIVTKDFIIDKFRGLIASEVTDVLVNTIAEKNIPIINITAYLKQISEGIKPYIERLFEEYGFIVPQFRLIKVLLPESDPQYKRLKSLRADEGLLLSELELKRQADIIRARTKAETEILGSQAKAEKIKLEADAMAFKRQTEGYTYQQERQFDVMQSAVENEGSGSVAGLSGEFMQLGAGLGVMGTVGEMMRDNLGGMTKTGVAMLGNGTDSALKCPKCGESVAANAKFCPGCGEKLSVSIICPNCGKETAKGRFCINCGHKLEENKRVCAKCNGELPDNAKFCLNCGAKVE